MKFSANMLKGALAALIAAVGPAVSAQTQRPDARILDSIAGSGIAQGRAAGLVAAVVRGNDTIFMKAYGKANIEWDVPMATDAMFEIGSIAKQFAAASILQLADSGKLGLDDEVTKWLPSLRLNGKRVTLRHLLSHTSGINGFADDTPQRELNMFIPGAPRDSLNHIIAVDSFRFEPGTAQAYSNAGFHLLGLVVERASGMGYEDYLARRIFEPLGMKRSMYCNSMAIVPKRAQGYQMMGPMSRRAPMVNYTWVFAPGAMCSTAGDLVIWLSALHGGKVLSPRSYAEMTTPSRLSDGTAVQYGLGIKVGEDYRGLKYIGHGGSAPGFRSDATWYPESQTAVIVLINTSPATISAGDIAGELARTVLPLPRPELARYTGDPSEFVGSYELVAGGNFPIAVITVSASPSGLAFSVNGSRAEPLPWAGGLRFYAQPGVTLTFRRANGATGPITELRRDDPGNHAILRKR